MVGSGFAYWRRRPGRMALGLIPAAIVGAVLLGALIALGFFVPEIADAVTPFADTWPAFGATLLRVAVSTALFGGAVVLAAVSFTALTLLIGDPFYERIWTAVETDLGGSPVEAAGGFWRSLLDGASLVARGLVAALAAALLGFVPVVGGILGGATAIVLSGWLLADELTSRALTARGIPASARRRLRRRHRARVLGFGVATQLCFMVPLGAVVTMPAAVAGSTVLARFLLDPADAARPAAGTGPEEARA